MVLKLQVVVVKLGKNSIFLKNGKTKFFVIVQVENLDFFYILDDEMNITVKFLSRNLITQSNFFIFRDSRDFTFFETLGVG